MEFRTWDLEGQQIKLNGKKYQIHKQIYFRFLLQVLSIRNMYVWIGLNDKATEGTWVWVNGERAIVPGAILWIADKPDSLGNEDCGEIIANNRFAYGTNDAICSRSRIALCEKRYIS